MAMVPPPIPTEQAQNRIDDDEPIDAIPVLDGMVRGTLLWIAALLVAVFGVALWLDPYDRDEDGKIVGARTMETHTQIGLPPCTFKRWSGQPCPSCGMTTSFALLMHGDPSHSSEANAVGTVLALFCLLLVPWCLVCAIWGRPLFVMAIERAVTKLIIVFLFLMLTRWGIFLAVAWLYPVT